MTIAEICQTNAIYTIIVNLDEATSDNICFFLSPTYDPVLLFKFEKLSFKFDIVEMWWGLCLGLLNFVDDGDALLNTCTHF